MRPKLFSNALMPSQKGSEGNSKLNQENTKAAAPEAHRRESTVVLREYGEETRAGCVGKRAIF